MSSARNFPTASVTREAESLWLRAQRHLQTVGKRATCEKSCKVERRCLDHKTPPVQKPFKEERIRAIRSPIQPANLDEETVTFSGKELLTNVHTICHEIVMIVLCLESKLFAMERDEVHVFCNLWCLNRRKE